VVVRHRLVIFMRLVALFISFSLVSKRKLLASHTPREICPQVDLALDQLVAQCTAMEESERPASSLALCRLIEALQTAGEESVATRGQVL